MAAIFLCLLSSVLLGLSAAMPAAQEREKREVSTDCHRDFDVNLGDMFSIQSTVHCGYNSYYPNNADWTFTLVVEAGTYLSFEYDIDIESHYRCRYDKLTFDYGHTENSICGTQTGTFSTYVYRSRYELHFKSDSGGTGRGFYLVIYNDNYPRYSTSNRPHYNLPANPRLDSTPYYHNDYTSSYYTTDRYSTDRSYGDYTTGYFTHDYYNSYRPNYYDYTTDYTSPRYNDYTTDYTTRRYYDYTTDSSSPRYYDYTTDDTSRRYYDYTTDYSGLGYGTPGIPTECRRQYYIGDSLNYLTINGVAECGTVQGESPGDYPNNADWTFTITNMMPMPGVYLNIEYDVDIESADQCRYDKLTFGYGSEEQIHVCGVQKGNFSVRDFNSVYVLQFKSDGSVTRRGFNLSVTADYFPHFSTSDVPHYNSPASGGYEGSSTTSYYTTDYGHQYNTDYFRPARSTPSQPGTDEYPGHGPSNEERKAARLESLRSELRELVDAARETVLSFDDFEDAYYQDKPRDLTAIRHDTPRDPSGFHHDMLRAPADFLDMPRDPADFHHDMPNDVYDPLGIRF